jgi:hypothetical protein
VRRHRHLTATLGTLAAHLGAAHHSLIAACHTLAFTGAITAYFGADAADPFMAVGASEHEVGAHVANFGAIHQ